MLQPLLKCTICDTVFDVTETNQHALNEDISSHILSHIPKADVFELFECFDYAMGDERFDNRKEDIQAIVDRLYIYGDFKRFDDLRNTDEWISEIMEAAWEVMDEVDDTWNWGEQDIPQEGTLRQAISKIVHEYVTNITQEHLHKALTEILVMLDVWREREGL